MREIIVISYFVLQLSLLFYLFKNLPMGVHFTTKIFPLRARLVTSSQGLIYKINIRTMYSSRCLHAARAAYYTLHAIGNDNVVNNTSRYDHKAIISSLLANNLNHSKGIIQHKAKISNHILNTKFSADECYAAYQNMHPNPKISWIPKQKVMMHALAEIPTLHEYHTEFDKNIVSTICTLDTPTTNIFPHQRQPNIDFLVKLDRAMGLGTRSTYQDEKSGMDMVKHTTSGSIGILTYDHEGKQIQFTKSPIDLSLFNKDRRTTIPYALKNEGLSSVFEEQSNYLKAEKPLIDPFKEHEKIQNYLFNELQCDPQYNRSISFIFNVHLKKDLPNTEETRGFARDFLGLLDKGKLYNLDVRQDCYDITKALIMSYKKNVDPNIISKLHHLDKECDIILNYTFLTDLTGFIKHNIIHLLS